MASHQHRFRPAQHTSCGPLRYFQNFACKCGATASETPPMPVSDWRWKYLTDNGLRREWRKRCGQVTR